MDLILGGPNGLAAVYGALLCSGVFGLLIAKPFDACAAGLLHGDRGVHLEPGVQPLDPAA
jgi:hypothetical protein